MGGLRRGGVEEGSGCHCSLEMKCANAAYNFSHTRAYNDSHASDSASLQRHLIHMSLQFLYTEASVVSRLTIPTCRFQRHKGRERIGYLFRKSSERFLALRCQRRELHVHNCRCRLAENPPCSKHISQQSLLVHGISNFSIDRT